MLADPLPLPSPAPCVAEGRGGGVLFRVRIGMTGLEGAAMMRKKTIDTLGGVGSILAGGSCLVLAMRHNSYDDMFKVWIGMFLLLLANGFLMLIQANRSGGVTRLAKDIFHMPGPHRIAKRSER
jgi:hypothetical protein